MSEIQEIEQESFIQKWAPYLVAGVLAGAVAFYLLQFQGGLSAKQATWGQFGDFVGGAVNPIIGFFTIWLLAVSLRQNHKALSQANTALAQAKAELELTRISIEQNAEIQTATETALKQQIEIAAHARDMNNAVAIHDHLTSIYERAGAERRSAGQEEVRRLYSVQNETRGKMGQLERVLEDERLRIIAGYGGKR